ncbi:MAG: VPLPA-CTERM sorting domain-containing protein, partial [Pseudomonadota bacterium]
FSTEALGIELTSFSLDAFSFNNSGNIQGQNVVREVDITLIISEDGGAELFNEKADNVHLNPPGPDGGPFPVSFDTSLVSLVPNTAYTLTLIASSDTRVRGNNAAIDTLILSGTLTGVPLPAGFSLLLAGLAGFAALRRRA